jgi:hypothetical protein
VIRGSVVPGFLDDGHWSACFGLSWSELLLFDLRENRRVMNDRATFFRKVTGTGGIPDSRNAVCKSFLDQSEAEWLWFIDTDMGFAPDTIDRLVDSADEHKRPVMGGLAFAQRRVEPGPFHADRFGIIATIYDYTEIANEDGPPEVGFMPRQHYARDTVTQASATGAACMLIHRRALNLVRRQYGDEWFSIATHPTGLKGKPRHFSEDLSFCVRLQAVGVPVHVDTSVKTVHEKGGIFLEEELYLAQQAASAPADSSSTSAA